MDISMSKNSQLGENEDSPMDVDSPANQMDDGSSRGTSSFARENSLAVRGMSPMTIENAVTSENSPMAIENTPISGNNPITSENSLTSLTANEGPGMAQTKLQREAIRTSAISGKNPMASENSLISPTANESPVMAPTEVQMEPTGPQEDLYTAEDSGTCLLAEVEWPEAIPASKRKFELERAVQTLLNKGNMNDCTVEPLENGPAKIWVKCPSAADQLCKEQQLVLKIPKSQDKVKAKVRFSPVPSAPPAPLASPQSPVTDRLQKPDVNGKIGQWEQNPGSWLNSATPSAGNESAAFSHGDAPVEKEPLNVPLFQYWHVAAACSKEIAQIQSTNGVDIEGVASLSFTAPVHDKGKSSVQRAQEEFTDLFQKCAPDIHIITIPITSLDPGKMVEMLKEILREECKLVLSVSSKGCQLSGPRESLERFQRRFRLESCPRDSEVTLNKTLDMDIQDPLEKEGLPMDSFHWEFISTVFQKQVTAIKQKFGVDFATETGAGTVNVKAVPAGEQRFPLACHALKALEQLYQKAVTDILACPLDKSINSKLEDIKSTFEQIRAQYPYVAAGEANGPWRLVGLAEHLWPAVMEVEKQLGEPVFCEKAKLLLQCPEPSPAASEGAAVSQAGFTEEKCPICLDAFENKKKLKCTHEFCRDCLKQAEESLGPCCPVCKQVYGKMEGNQPDGRMQTLHIKTSLPGFLGYGTIEIEYYFPGGTQTKKHPNPGKRFCGTHRTAYLPDSPEGREVLKLLQRAFDQKLIFTVGTSTTTGATDTVTWNDIHHKTCVTGGPQSFGYPDPDYLKRVKEELKAKGIE